MVVGGQLHALAVLSPGIASPLFIEYDVDSRTAGLDILERKKLDTARSRATSSLGTVPTELP